MKDYRIEVRVRNNLLLEKILDEYDTVAAFSRVANLHPTVVGALVNLKAKPFKMMAGRMLNGQQRQQSAEWREAVLQIARTLHCLPEDLFPEAALAGLTIKAKAEIKVDQGELEQALEQIEGPAQTPEDALQIKDKRDVLHDALKDLPPREAMVLAMRYGLDGKGERTLEEVGNVFGVGRGRIRQIEVKALRKIQGRERLIRQGRFVTGFDGRSRLSDAWDFELPLSNKEKMDRWT